VAPRPGEAAPRTGEAAPRTGEAAPRTGLLGLGSNVGDRRGNLQAAVKALRGACVEAIASSSVYDTEPVGEILAQPSFLNACLLMRTALEPLALLDAVKRLERELGRAAVARRHAPRAIDIDVLMLGELEMEHERIALPHGQLLRRRFALVPAVELDASLSTPSGQRLADALARLDPRGEDVRWAGPPLSM
jgi:2-amino-4-hydroxy-6-hydroxymethyldihydropteridine diphosphokinase